MDNEFRTTFIPKTPIAQQPVAQSSGTSKPVGILFVISLIIFIVSIGIGAGVYVYKSYLQKQVDDLAVSLERVQKSLDPNAIKEFTVMDKRLKNAETLLSSHVVSFPLLDMLRKTTLPTVRYTKMDFEFTETGDLSVKLSGESDSYRSIALQSQALAQNANLSDTIFSNFVVTPKGRVSFDVAFTIPKTDLTFAKNIDADPSAAEEAAATEDDGFDTESTLTDDSIQTSEDTETVGAIQ